MGIDYHALKFLMYARSKTSFGAVATIGRQGLHLPPWRVRRVIGSARAVDFGDYCERLLVQHFGAESVDSYDNSDYEAATRVRDMNRALTSERTYDTVIDAGCLEHVYDAPQALRNVSSLTKVGGQILHVLPANGFCGHGFWQFSPELFYALYSERNGYADTEVFLADLTEERRWYRVRKPTGGRRAEVLTAAEVYALVRTRRAREVAEPVVQQSDYVHAWQHESAAAPRPAASLPARRQPPVRTTPRFRSPTLRWMWLMTYRRFCSLLGWRSLSRANPWLTHFTITDWKL